MQYNLIPTLAAWEDFIWIGLVLATVVGSWIGNLKKKHQEQRTRDEGPNASNFEEIAARRREQLRQVARQQTQVNTSIEGAPGAASGMTMAERIARARAKAQQEQGVPSRSQPAGVAQPQVPNEAQRRVLEQRHAELERRRQAAHAQAQQQQAQHHAQQRAIQQRAKAKAHAQAQANARHRGKLIHEPVAVPEPSSSTVRRLVPGKPTAPPKPVKRPQPFDLIPRGPLSRSDLRRAIILKEILDKPIALRETQTY